MVSKDESLSQSNDLYKFLCPSPDFYNEKKNKHFAAKSSGDEKFFLTSLFKSSKSKEVTEDEFLDELFTETDSRSLDGNEKDSIAEPFYQLIEELFELKGMKRIFRKSLILFVQLTYGATINCKIRQSIYWLFNDEMVSFYLKQLKESMWKVNLEKNETELIIHEVKTKTNEEKSFTKKLAKQKLSVNVPGFFFFIFLS